MKIGNGITSLLGFLVVHEISQTLMDVKNVNVVKHTIMLLEKYLQDVVGKMVVLLFLQPKPPRKF
jgi:hypothetical protein